jgi:hypothetical protein
MTPGAARHLAEAKARADRRSALARHQATGHRADQPIARLLAGFEPRATAAGTCRARRRGEPGASAAHRRRSARTTATLRSRARSGLARPRPYWPPGWRRCSRPEVPTAMLHLCVPTENRARSVVDAATIIPSTDSGVRAATQPGCPCNSTSPGAYEGRRLCQRSAQQSNASDRCSPDPPVRAGGHDRLPTGNSPVSTHWFLGAHTPRTRVTSCAHRRAVICVIEARQPRGTARPGRSRSRPTSGPQREANEFRVRWRLDRWIR